MTAVRISVAKSESIPASPNLAKTVVRAANTAESNAHTNHCDAAIR